LTNGIYLYPTLIELNGVTFGSEGSGVIAADTIEDLTYANGIDLMSGSFFGNWTLSGNGAAVTNLSGANIQANTINSNKLDAATRALLGGTGGGSSGTNQLYTSGALTPYVPLSYDASSNVVAGAALSYPYTNNGASGFVFPWVTNGIVTWTTNHP
jgi:hypothetical protein